MFTGIITDLGRLESRKGGVFVFGAEKSFLTKIKKGSSICVNGACLTVKSKSQNNFQVDLMPETLRRTAFDNLKRGAVVNLELPMIMSGKIDGHFVQGHVDGTAIIKKIEKKGNSHIFFFQIPQTLSRYIPEKGSIAVNGISLTVIEAHDTFFSVGIVPYTWENTMLHTAKTGDRVNIEVDILAKYLDKLASRICFNRHSELVSESRS